LTFFSSAMMSVIMRLVASFTDAKSRPAAASSTVLSSAAKRSMKSSLKPSMPQSRMARR